jgi:hypothetical protein
LGTRIERGFGAFALALLAAACGSSDPVALIAEGHTALGFNDAKSAQLKFEAALRELQPGCSEYIGAKLGVIRAKIPSDGGAARNDFMELAAGYPNSIGETEFVFIGGQMVSARKFDDAVKLLQSGTKIHGESPTLMAQIDRVRKEAMHDPDAARALRSCGYL